MINSEICSHCKTKIHTTTKFEMIVRSCSSVLSIYNFRQSLDGVALVPLLQCDRTGRPVKMFT